MFNIGRLQFENVLSYYDCSEKLAINTYVTILLQR